jgi:D-sedoheptulose 7-phosphate isomerase
MPQLVRNNFAVNSRGGIGVGIGEFLANNRIVKLSELQTTRPRPTLVGSPAQRGPGCTRLIARYPALDVCCGDILSTISTLRSVFSSGKKLLVCGNGGSAADSEHIVGELMKGFLKKRPIGDAARERLAAVADREGTEVAANLQEALPAIALTSQVSLTSAISNDTNSDMVFAQQVYGLGDAGDALLGISTSGNSSNVINAFIVAKALGLQTIALTGRSGCRLALLADIAIRVPADGVAEIQEFHLPVYHALCIDLEEAFFSS